MPADRASSPSVHGTVLVDPAQERVRGAGQLDAGRRGEPGVPVAVRLQAVELLERPLRAGQIGFHRPDPTLVV